MIVTLQTLIFFRESLLKTLDRLLRPYYNRLSLAFSRRGDVSDDEESDEQVFAEYDDERGVVFYPAMYLQRYAAVSDCLMDGSWSGKLEKVVDLGYHDMSFIKYLKEVQGVKCILGVDLESIPLRCSLDLIDCEDYVPKKENPLDITLFKGNAADPDYRLIGCDAVIAIEMIEHMLPHDLDRLVHTVFGFIKPWVAIFTTPNGDFNVLFKAMEKNGLRRLDHFFEWSRDQFHDWCSNIVVRYPQYTVSCKGIGPGPNGTEHLGTCSQMAVFVAKEYNKQQDLNLNSLALVSDSPSPENISNLISSWETCDIPNERNMIEAPKNTESYSEIASAKQSSVSILLSTPSCSNHTIPYQDKTSQCNIDAENDRGYLMFDNEQMCFDVLEPRRNVELHRVYDIEDVYNRLNCTTLEVKKFSRATQNLMAKNKVETPVHTREVINEVRHLTKMLNFNKELNNQLENGTNTWCNVNWGENAPYWNQYYTIVKAYNYPVEVKSEECHILDLISDEINSLIDSQFDEDFSFEVNKLEIPIEHLMTVLKDVTDDVDRVKDLLEWNGYEVVDDVVIHSRKLVDYSPAGTQEEESQDASDIYSDWDSTSLSDGSANVSDYHARCIRRALDQKVRRLRSMLTADEDITTQLDQVVCRLLKLALRISRGRNTPPPTIWMQCKLLDLLTLTENSIERRKRHFIESFPLMTINYGEKSHEMLALEKFREDDTASKIVDKYKHLVDETDDMEYRYLDFDLEDDLSVSSPDFVKGYGFKKLDSIDLIRSDLVQQAILPLDSQIFEAEDTPQGESKLKRTQAWVEEDVEVVPYPCHDCNFDSSSVSTGHIASNITKYYKKRYKGKQCIELNCVICKKTKSRGHRQRADESSKDNSRTKLVKTVTRKRSSNHSMGLHTTYKKYVSIDCKTYRVKPRRTQYKNLCPTLSKPIPVSLLELCRPETMIINEVDRKTDTISSFDYEKVSYVMKNDVANTEQTMLIDIITEDIQETIALQRTIGTEVDVGAIAFEEEKLIRSVSSTVMKENYSLAKYGVSTENIISQTIFLYDIDEPTTSKGIRQTGMDVQCGPDSDCYTMLSTTSSLTRVPKVLSAGLKFRDPPNHSNIRSSEFGTCTYDSENNHRTILSRQRSGGIRIKDSDSNLLVNRMELLTAPTYFIQNPTEFSISNVLKQSNSLANIRNSFCGRDVSPLPKNSKTTLFKSGGSNVESEANIEMYLDSCTSTLKSGGSNVESEANIEMYLDSCTSTQEPFKKLVGTSQELFPQKTTGIQDTLEKIKRKDFSSNLPLQTKYLTKTKQFEGNVRLAAKKTFLEPTSARCIPKKTVNNKIKDQVQRSLKQVTRSPSIQKLCDKLKAATHDLAKTVELKNSLTKNCVITSASDLDLQFVTQCLPCNEFYDVKRAPTSSPCSFSKYTDNGSKLNQRMTDELNNLPKHTDCPVESLEACISNASRPYYEETTGVTSEMETTVGELTSEILCINVNSAYNTSTSSTLYISETHALSENKNIAERSGQPTSKNKKPKLCSGGVQVHSYKDQQALFEDIMYQGNWQENMPKKLTKRKCFIPMASKKSPSNTKKQIDSRKIITSKENTCNKATKTKISKEKICVKNIKKGMKKEQRQPLMSRNSTNERIIKENDKNENKENRKVPKTLCVATVAKPFRNILKVPSKFPVSRLPSTNIKPHVVEKKSLSPPTSLPKSEKTQWKRPRNNYIPPYLRRRTLCLEKKIDKHQLGSSAGFSEPKTYDRNENAPKLLVRSETEEIQRDLLKFQTSLAVPQYLVFRNEVEKEKNDKLQLKNTSNSVKKDTSKLRSSTPNSANSSTCSSPCSIATVRAVPVRTKNATNRRYSASPSYVNSTGTDSETSTPERNRKFTKRGKSAKVDNKENIPQTSRHFNSGKREKLKAPFTGYKNDVYVAQVKEGNIQSTINVVSRHKDLKTNVNIPKTITSSDRKSSSRPNLSRSNTPSTMLNATIPAACSNEASGYSQTSNVVLVIDPHARQLHIPTDLLNEGTTVVNRYYETNKLHSNNEDNIIESQSSEDKHSAVRELIEEALGFIDDPFDSETVILSQNSARDDILSSPASFKTIVTSYDNYMNEVLPTDIEFALNQFFDETLGNEDEMSLNDNHLTVTDFDMMSFKSIISGSKLSGYLSADNEFSSSIKLPKCANSEPNASSIRDIFERKDRLLSPDKNVTGTLANLAFSGFTINEEAVTGDQPDHVNLIDSETGNFEMSIARQATSEELLISARSSDSYDSCEYFDDDVVPSWLFHIINQQRSGSDDIDIPVEVQVPQVEPLLDDNANLVEAPGAGAGAGDGRGIHSDQSQDSSGQGTSISSSDISSGLQSEAILIDPAAFAAQFELLREAAVAEGSVILMADDDEPLNNVTLNRQALIEADQQSFSRGESRRTPRAVPTSASDVDADVSSLDTDVEDPTQH